MVIQPRFRLIGVLIRQLQLFRRIADTRVADARVVLHHQAVFHIERRGHVQPIQPHLVGVALFVPESPVGCARLTAQLVAQHLRRPQVLFIPRRLVEIQQLPPVADVIQIEGIERVVANRAAFVGHERVHCVLDVIEILLFARHGVQRLHAAPRHAVVIVPAAGQQAVTLHQAIRHFRGGVGHKFFHCASSSNFKAICAIRTAPMSLRCVLSCTPSG